jgi:hypothetical protein
MGETLAQVLRLADATLWGSAFGVSACFFLPRDDFRMFSQISFAAILLGSLLTLMVWTP